MKRVLLLRDKGATTPIQKTWLALGEGVTEQLKASTQVVTAHFGDLIYDASDNNSKIIHATHGWDISSFDLVIFRRVGKEIELAMACAHYLEYKDVKYIDEYLSAPGKSKLVGSFLRVANGLPIPRTIYAQPEIIIGLFSDNPPFKFPIIVKSDFGHKGKDNYLATSFKELNDVFKKTSTPMIVQPYLENDGDYRLLILNGRLSLALFRRASGGSHLNNISVGGTATLEDASSISSKITTDAVAAARLERLTVAGVDILIDKHTGRHVILEVNRAPQISDGAFHEKKIIAYSEMIKELLES